MTVNQELTKQSNYNFVLEPRACTILFNFITSNKSPLPYVMPANICPIVPITFFKAGQTIQFADIIPETFSLDEKICLELARNQKIGGILLVHTYGEVTSHSEFFSKLKNIDPNIFIIDDRCLCKPDFSEPLFENIDLILYSTGYGKYVDAGSGGFGWIKQGISYKESHLPFNQRHLEGLEQGYKASIQSKSVFHYRDNDWLETRPMDMDFQSFSIKVTEVLKEMIQMKTQINKIYRKLLPAQIQLPEIFNDWRFNILVPNKTEVLKALFDNHLFASSHYASLGGIMAEGVFPFAEDLHTHIINLFNDQHFSVEQAQKTTSIINQVLR